MVSPRCADTVGQATLALMSRKMKQRHGLRQRLAFGLYRLVFLLVLPALWLGILWRGLRQRAYWQKLRQRWGYISVIPSGWGGILVHAASVGEVHAARPLVDALLKLYPDQMITLSCQTPTGLALVEKEWSGRVRGVYLPMDTRGACRRFLDRLQPRLLILLERELWPVLLHECEIRVIRVALVNARLSERSERMCKRLAWVMQPALAQLCAVHAADVTSAQRLLDCGVVAERVQVGGNLKFDIPVHDAWGADEVQALGAIRNRPVVVLASSHDGEESQVLKHWPSVLEHTPQALLVIVPRHPHRFEQVAKLIEQSALRLTKRSSMKPIDFTDQAVLVDTMGELQQWYRLATVCAVAGSWIPIGGHNALEALLVGKPVLFGPHTHNFETLYAEIEQAGAGERTANVAQLIDRVKHWLGDAPLLAKRSYAALQWLQSHRGADQRAMMQLVPFLPALLKPTVQEISGKSTTWHDPELLGNLPLPWRLKDSSASADMPTHPLRGGRGKVKLLQDGSSQFVLRHYYRGGLVGKVLGDRFLRKKPYLGRSAREYHLLSLMHAWQLPVPQTVAAHHQAGCLFDRCDLLMTYVENSVSLHTVLCNTQISQDAWGMIGKTIAQHHTFQIDHVDLNCHNILLQTSHAEQVVVTRPVLIDFDKCALRGGESWKKDNLNRLLRSLKKEKRLRPDLCWHQEHWQWLTNGYAGFEPASPVDPLAQARQAATT
jgi:3-deoxy-D-manno-octulosonic-acid transferase